MKVMVPLLGLAVSAGAMSACTDDNSDTASTEPTVEEAPAPTVAEDSATLTAETGPRPGSTYAGEVEGEPGLAGTVTVVVSESGEEVTELMLDLDLSDYACGASVTMSGGLGLGVEGPIAIEGDSFRASNASSIWEGVFESELRAAGTVQASLPSAMGGPACEIGPLSWTAEPA